MLKSIFLHFWNAFFNENVWMKNISIKISYYIRIRGILNHLLFLLHQEFDSSETENSTLKGFNLIKMHCMYIHQILREVYAFTYCVVRHFFSKEIYKYFLYCYNTRSNFTLHNTTIIKYILNFIIFRNKILTILYAKIHHRILFYGNKILRENTNSNK